MKYSISTYISNKKNIDVIHNRILKIIETDQNINKGISSYTYIPIDEIASWEILVKYNPINNDTAYDYTIEEGYLINIFCIFLLKNGKEIKIHFLNNMEDLFMDYLPKEIYDIIIKDMDNNNKSYWAVSKYINFNFYYIKDNDKILKSLNIKKRDKYDDVVLWKYLKDKCHQGTIQDVEYLKKQLEEFLIEAKIKEQDLKDEKQFNLMAAAGIFNHNFNINNK